MIVHGAGDAVRIESANPYRRITASTVRLHHAGGAVASGRVLYGKAFRRHSIACVREGITPLTPLDGGLEDLELAERIIQALPPKPLA